MSRHVMRGFHPPATRQPLEISSGRVDDEANKFLAFSGYVPYHSFHICDTERYRVESSQSQNLSQHWITKSFSASLWLRSLGVESVSSCHVTDLQRDWQGAFCFHDEETDSGMEGWAWVVERMLFTMPPVFCSQLITSFYQLLWWSDSIPNLQKASRQAVYSLPSERQNLERFWN